MDNLDTAGAASRDRAWSAMLDQTKLQAEMAAPPADKPWYETIREGGRNVANKVFGEGQAGDDRALMALEFFSRLAAGGEPTPGALRGPSFMGALSKANIGSIGSYRALQAARSATDLKKIGISLQAQNNKATQLLAAAQAAAAHEYNKVRLEIDKSKTEASTQKAFGDLVESYAKQRQKIAESAVMLDATNPGASAAMQADIDHLYNQAATQLGIPPIFGRGGGTPSTTPATAPGGLPRPGDTIRSTGGGGGR